MQRPDDSPPPLPPDWLPEPGPPEGSPEWETRLARIMTAAEPALERIRGSAIEPAWWSALGWWWRPAAAFVLAAAAILAALGPLPAAGESTPDAVTLGVVAAVDEPLALWESLGIEADPVLALIIWQERSR